MTKFVLVEYNNKFYILNHNVIVSLGKKMIKEIVRNKPFKKTRLDALAEIRRKNGTIVFTISITPWR